MPSTNEVESDQVRKFLGYLEPQPGENQLPTDNDLLSSDEFYNRVEDIMYYEVTIQPATGEFGEWQVSPVNGEGWQDKDDLLDAMRDGVESTGSEFYVLGEDELPENVEDIRGSIHNEPDMVVAMYDPGQEYTAYFGVVSI